MTIDEDTVRQMMEDAELDAHAEQVIREDVCEERGHDYRLIVACRRCGDAAIVHGFSDEEPS